MVVGDPALVVVLAGGRGHGDRLGAGQGGVGVDRLLGLLRRLDALSLREEGLDPRLVDKVQRAGKGGREDDVEEDAGGGSVSKPGGNYAGRELG